MSTSDDTPDPTLSSLQADMLRHYGRRFFAEAQNVSAGEAAELAAWKRDHNIEQRKWWPGGSGGTPTTSDSGLSDAGGDSGVGTDGSDVGRR